MFVKNILLILLLILSNMLPAWSDTSFNQGVQLYQKRDFTKAAQCFKQSAKESGGNSSVYYYLALCYHQLKDFSSARKYYAKVVTDFPGTQAAQLAAMALQQIDPELLKQLTGSTTSLPPSGGTPSSSADNGELMSAPDQTRIYCTRSGNRLLVDAQVNNRPIKMMFDTGAEGCVFGKNHLKQLGIQPPTGVPNLRSVGVGSNQPVSAWAMPVDLQVGAIHRRNLMVVVQENLPMEPLLGQSFFRDFEYTIDAGANSIVLKKKTSTMAVDDTYSVPFAREGNEMVVSVEINDHPYPMFFDTGADGIAFSNTDLKRLGISIPEDAQVEMHTGIGGVTKGWSFVIRRMRLGPIDRNDVRISVVDSNAMPRPLLGQTFYQGWQYRIDNERKVIHFVRR